MAWSLIEDVPSHEGHFEAAERADEFSGTKFRRTSTKTIALSLWRHHPCGKLACGQKGVPPGDCLWCNSPSLTKDQDRRGKR